MGKKWALLIVMGFEVFSSTLCFAARKDFKGLFGSYRREKFTENEARSSDFGVDFLLSTLFPVNAPILSTETSAAPTALPGSLFFDLEASFFFTLGYNLELFLNAGYYTYSNRKQNTIFTQPDKPLFHQFDMTAYPGVLGVRYRFSTEDIVPYIGAGVGGAYVTRTGSYDYAATVVDTEYTSCLVFEAVAGIEFFFSPRAGIRLETSAINFRLGSRTFAPGTNYPTMTYAGNPWLMRYASGIFFLF